MSHIRRYSKMIVAASPLPPSLLCHPLQHSRLKTKFSNPILCPKLTSIPPKPTHTRSKTKVLGTNSNDPKESAFVDDNGVIEDMDGYMNYLSLEYDSVWDTKPSWCQPWTIMLTGLVAIASSWLVLQSAVVTTGVICLICAWWYIFLYTYPKAYTNMIAEQRKKVTDSVEDTFGLRNGQ